MREKPIQSQIMLALGARPDTRVFRNSVGYAILPNGTPITFGLCPGSADLIGWHTVTVTPDMVGRRLAVFLSVEVKGTKGRPSLAQLNWQRVVDEAGGIAVIARSVDEAVARL